MYTKVGRALVAVAAAGALVSGCGSPVQAGSAIIVGDTAVPLEQVQSQVGTLLARVPAEQRQQDTAPTLARDIVTNELLHTLLARAAAEQGITVTDAEVDAFIEQQGGAQTLLQNSVLDLEGLRSQAHDFLVATALGRKAAPGLAVTIDLVGAPNRTDAEAKARTLAAGGPAADALFNDARTARRGVEVAAATDTQNAGSVVFGTPVGDVVAYQPDPQQATWNVFRVTDRRTDARPRRPGRRCRCSSSTSSGSARCSRSPTTCGAGQPALRRLGPGRPARRPGRPDARASCSPRAAERGPPEPRGRAGAGRGAARRRGRDGPAAVAGRLPVGRRADPRLAAASTWSRRATSCTTRSSRATGPRCARSSATSCCRCCSTRASRPRTDDRGRLHDRRRGAGPRRQARRAAPARVRGHRAGGHRAAPGAALGGAEAGREAARRPVWTASRSASPRSRWRPS